LSYSPTNKVVQRAHPCGCALPI